MAYIGMRYPVFAPVSSHTDGSAISYGSGMVIGPAVAANVTFDTQDNPDYGDDIVIDSDNGINGYSISLEVNDISAAGRASLLGWKAKTSGTPATVQEYEITDEEAPLGGFGFVRVKLYNGTRKYEGFWFHKLRFVSSSEDASTKQKQITWNHPKLTGTGIGAYIDDSGNAKYFSWMEFDTEAAAKSWLNTKAGISS